MPSQAKRKEPLWPSGYGCWACLNVQDGNPAKFSGVVRKGNQPYNAPVQRRTPCSVAVL